MRLLELLFVRMAEFSLESYLNTWCAPRASLEDADTFAQSAKITTLSEVLARGRKKLTTNDVGDVVEAVRVALTERRRTQKWQAPPSKAPATSVHTIATFL